MPDAASTAAEAAPVARAASTEALLKHLEWTVIRRLDGLLQGDYRTLWRGAGLDLADLREYQHHDDVRHIDWNVTARMGTTYVRTFLEEYCALHAKAVETTMAYALTDNITEADRARLQERYAKEVTAARAFLFADDVPEPQRARASRVRAALLFIESYRELPLLAWPREVIDAIVAFEQQFVVFRQRHARMVERVIGRRQGTGGSAGVEYLDTTALKYRVFREVWAVRTLLLREGDLPALRKPEIYGFASGAT